MELKLVIDGLDTALAELTEQIVDLNGSSVVRHNELLVKLDGVNAKLDAVHTMLSHLADTQAAHGVQLNAIMAALYAHK